MTRYVMASNKAGMGVPWVYARRQLAAKWGCRPWEVDAAPIDEVLLEMEISEIEAKGNG